MAQSKCGIASVVLAVAAAAAAAAMVWFTLDVYGEHGNSGDQARLRAGLRAAGIAARASAGLAIAGAVAGTVGLTRTGRGKGTAVAGVVLCGVLLMFFGLILAIQMFGR